MSVVVFIGVTEGSYDILVNKLCKYCKYSFLLATVLSASLRLSMLQVLDLLLESSLIIFQGYTTTRKFINYSDILLEKYYP